MSPVSGRIVEAPSRIHLSETQLDHIARLLTVGVSYHEIAAAFRLPLNRVRGLDLHDPDMQDRKAVAAGSLTRALVVSRFRMIEQLDEAIRVLEHDGLHSKDIPTRLSTAKWWVDRTLPRPSDGRDHEGATVNVQLPESFVDSIGKMANMVETLKPVLAGMRPLESRVRSTLSTGIPFVGPPDPTTNPASDETAGETDSEPGPDPAA